MVKNESFQTLRNTDMTYSDALQNFVTLLQTAITAHNTKKFHSLNPPTVKVMPGRKYDRVILVDTSRCVYCFINRETGGLLKGNWKRVEDERERGNIYNTNPLQGCNRYGLDYLNMSNVGYQF